VSITKDTVMALRPTAFEVQSETDPERTYRVQLPDCWCPDFRYRRANPPEGRPARLEDFFCKHLWQAFKAAGWQVPVPRPDYEGLGTTAARKLLMARGAVRDTVDRQLTATGSLGGPKRVRLGDGQDATVWFDRFSGKYGVRLPA